ncbi:MAG: DNA/RNA nuclease SfsA [Calditerrivibrio nitroreducens]|uniref:DNA/RNA nuclease SfsA n=1 Tax=Calditerrivibrio nitroreducens TaxID=477976 RepID=A0A2J6WR34_9BACT|nr:MAG: DNA/RNA nuclease SfsA [Calditerrivibrio nitroreducens]
MLYFGRFIKRYKRFFVDVEYENNIITCHNPNTGSMRNLLVKGAPVCFSRSNNTKRKLQYTLEGIYLDNQWIQTNTIKTNRIVYNALKKGEIVEFTNITKLVREYSIGNNRIDFYLESNSQKILIEVKSVSLFDREYAMFPDAKTERGLKHLIVLKNSIDLGYIPYLLYLIQSNRGKFRCAEEFDKRYCEIYKELVPKFIKPLFYQNVFDPYNNTNSLHRLDILK